MVAGRTKPPRLVAHDVDAATLIDRLVARRWTVACAESCTGGLLGASFASVAGASEAFRGGVVAYHDDVKRTLLGVEPDLIDRFGAVSGAVAEAMAHGVRDRTGADVALAVTGVAGPEGGSAAKPVGTVWIAALGPAHLLFAHRFHFDGDREQIQQKAVREALAMLDQNLEEARLEAAGAVGP